MAMIQIYPIALFDAKIQITKLSINNFFIYKARYLPRLNKKSNKSMKIWVDADACPNVIKEILFRAAMRTQTTIMLVANQALYSPPSPFIKKIQVLSGFDVADNYIIQNMENDDLIITADILLADAVIDKGGKVLNPRGDLYTKDNIKQRLAFRNLNMQLRDGGLITGGPSKLSKKEIQDFANHLDKSLNNR